jgi:hypothetical protein
MLPWVPVSLPNGYSSSQVVAQDVPNSTSGVLDFFTFFCVPNVFSLCSCHLSMSSQHVPQVPTVFPNMVPITPDVIPYPSL